MGSRRLRSTIADAKLHVQAISDPHPRAIGRPTESPPQSFRLPDERHRHGPPIDFGSQMLPATWLTGEIPPSASCRVAAWSGRYPTSARFDNPHPEKRQRTRGAPPPAAQLRNSRRKAEPLGWGQGDGSVPELWNWVRPEESLP